MNFIQLKDQRINLDQVIQYYPTEKVVSILNEKQTWFNILFDHNDNATEGPIVVSYQTARAARDHDLMMLDFICVKNKRGNVKELQKKSQS